MLQNNGAVFQFHSKVHPPSKSERAKGEYNWDLQIVWFTLKGKHLVKM